MQAEPKYTLQKQCIYIFLCRSNLFLCCLPFAGYKYVYATQCGGGNYANAAKAKRKGKHRLAQRVRKPAAMGVAYALKWAKRKTEKARSETDIEREGERGMGQHFEPR